MKASDYFASLVSSFGVKRAYGLQGGAVVHLFDSLHRSGAVQCHYMHHEQSAAFAAVADAKSSKNLGLVVVTTGPGGTNALTGLLAAWQDSVPVIFVSGQTRLAATSYGKNVRQVGSQEFAILNAVKPLTKYSALIREVGDIARIFREARAAAVSGRPGPVWIDFPLDVQWQQVTPDEPVTAASVVPQPALTTEQHTQLGELARAIATAKRPLILAGHGVHLANAEEKLRRLCETHHLPLVATWGGSDLLETEHPLNGGVIGLSGQRGANRLVYQSDLLLVLGANLTQPQVGSPKGAYAPGARKIVISFDRDQLSASTVAVDVHIEADIATALAQLSTLLPDQPASVRLAWLARVEEAQGLNRHGSVDLDSCALTPAGKLSSNIAVARISRELQHSHHIVVDGGGTALYAGFQSAVRGKGKRLICSTGISAMGTGLAESVGVSLANGRCPILTIIGDGSFTMNVQDLASITQHRLPVAIALINNQGYLAIRHTQRDYLGARYYGTDEPNGLFVPPFEKIVEGFGLEYREITSYAELDSIARELAERPRGIVLDVQVDPDQDTLFRQGVAFNADGTSSPQDLSEMWPFTADAPPRAAARNPSTLPLKNDLAESIR